MGLFPVQGDRHQAQVDSSNPSCFSGGSLWIEGDMTEFEVCERVRECPESNFCNRLLYCFGAPKLCPLNHKKKQEASL